MTVTIERILENLRDVAKIETLLYAHDLFIWIFNLLNDPNEQTYCDEGMVLLKPYSHNESDLHSKIRLGYIDMGQYTEKNYDAIALELVVAIFQEMEGYSARHTTIFSAIHTVIEEEFVFFKH